MKTRARDKAEAAVYDSLYPFKTLGVDEGYPSSEHFQIVQGTQGTPAVIKARVAFGKGVRIARICGYAVSERRRHTLQLSPRIHLYDAWFCGLLQHSCSPNVFLDTTYLELWTAQPVPVGTALTVDYAATEDALFRQFGCHCGEPNCRGWITGSKEPLNAEGQAYIAWWREHQRS